MTYGSGLAPQMETTMNDERLIQLHRRIGRAAEAACAPRDDDVNEALSRGSWPEHDDSALDRVAASTAHADILRVVQALDADAQMLSREIASMRAPRVARVERRPLRWIAMAAALGGAALLIRTLPHAPGDAMVHEAIPARSAVLPQDVILSASFESEAPDAGLTDSIFGGDFDS